MINTHRLQPGSTSTSLSDNYVSNKFLSKMLISEVLDKTFMKEGQQISSFSFTDVLTNVVAEEIFKAPNPDKPGHD